jgi:hypothetical protein
MADSNKGAYKQIVDLRDTSGSTPADLGSRYSTGTASWMAVSASASIAAYGAVKCVGSTGYIVTPTSVVTDIVLGVIGSASVAASATTLIQTQGVATVYLLTGVASQAIDIGLVPTATAGALNIMAVQATTLLNQTPCGYLLVSALSTGAGSTGTAIINCTMA